MYQYFPILKNCLLFEGIDCSELEPLLKALDVRFESFEKNQTIRRPEVLVTEIGIVLEGMVYTTKTDYFGNRVILTQISAGATFGESLALTKDSNSPISIVAAQSSVIALLPTKKLTDYFAASAPFSTQLSQNLLLLIAQKNMLLQAKNDILSQKTTRQKLLLYFEYESKSSGSKTFRIQFSREELADFLSLNSNALSRELGKMQAEGLLTFKKNRFTLNI